MKPKQKVNKKTKLPISFHLVMDYLAQRSTLAEANIGNLRKTSARLMRKTVSGGGWAATTRCT